MKEYQYLSNIQSPDDVKKLSLEQLQALAREVRLFLVRSLAKTGGHLSSNLGVVELSIAIHKIFDSPADKVIWDVGHQSYTHKILTGRRDRFETLRLEDGISGFPKHRESEHDAFMSGHSSNSVSAGYGIAQALALNGDDHHVIAVIGDGSFTGGMVYEALNNAGRSKANLIVILNHNDMSISKNVGAFSKYLSLMRSKQGYHNFKHRLSHALDNTPIVGKQLKKSLSNSKSAIKRWVYNTTFFEEMGFEYMGPVDGHDLEDLLSVLESAKRETGPVVVHVDTTKGKGYRFAEENPGAYHAVGAFDPKTRLPDKIASGNYSDEFGRELARLAAKDQRICAITAAMKHATGLQHFYKQHRSRFFDVGIAEQHAVTFAAGLASQGKIPVFAVYSSFLQRGYDQLLHDCALEPQHMVLAIDRAGIVGADGETHQGIYDVAYLSSIPNMTIYSPETYEELRICLQRALYETPHLAAVRYPRGKEIGEHGLKAEQYHDYLLENAEFADTLVVTYGRLTSAVMEAAEKVKVSGGHTAVMKLLKIHPISQEAILEAKKYRRIFFYEEGIKQGGVGMQFLTALCEQGFAGCVRIIAIEEPVKQASVEHALQKLGLDAASIYRQISEESKEESTVEREND